MPSSRSRRSFGLRWALVLCVVTLAPWRTAARGRAQDEMPVIRGAVASLTFDAHGDAAPGATIVVGGVSVAILPGSSIELPASSLTVEGLFREAPTRCRRRGESGLAKADACRVEVEPVSVAATARGDAPPGARDQTPRVVTEIPPAIATIELAPARDGRLVAASVRLTRSLEELMGGVTFINQDEGYIRINGYYRQDVGGTLVRLNDPFRQHGDQSGAACGSEANCSSDPRFRVGAASFTVRFERGNPAYIGGDPADRKLLDPTDVVSRVPIVVGDNLTIEGAFEIAGGVRYFSTQAMVVQGNLGGER